MGIFTKLFARRELESGKPGTFSDAEAIREPDPGPAAPEEEATPPEDQAPDATPVVVAEPEPEDMNLRAAEEAISAGEDPGGAEPVEDDSVASAFGALVEDFFETSVAAGDDGEGDGSLFEEEAPQLALEGEAAAELRSTFAGVAARHLLPVRQLHQRLKEGPASVDWIGLCRPAVSTVGRTAVEMDLIELVRPFDQLAALLSTADRHGGQEIDGEARDNILQACDELVELFPEAFPEAIPDDDAQDTKESLTVHSVLRQVPQIGTVSLDKIFAAGLTAMQMLAQASSEDLSVTTGISEPLADRVRDAVDHFLDQTEDLREGGSPLGVLELLNTAVFELEQQHEAYRSTPETQEGFDQRKEYRRSRRLAQLRAHTYLAALGEVPLVEELQSLPLDRALERVHRYLSSFELSDPGSELDAAAADLLEE